MGRDDRSEKNAEANFAMTERACVSWSEEETDKVESVNGTTQPKRKQRAYASYRRTWSCIC
jgi:hypothetical protein